MMRALLDNQTDFNSNMVRLKVQKPIIAVADGLNFNSNMVRLKEAVTSTASSWAALFQFQYGSIKSIKPSICLK